MQPDNYVITHTTIKEPPQTFLSKLRFLGPGFILSASIVGSGELIATTALGAKAGFIAFWIIIVSCLVKVAIQLEFGKTAILHGDTPMRLFSGFSGRSRWAVWTVFLLTLLKIIQMGGMLGGSSLVMNMLFPGVTVFAWAIILAALVSILVFKNYYTIVERGSLIMVAGFTAMTIISLIAVTFTPYRFTFSDVMSGLQFTLPSSLILLAIGAFGITGVASDEIIAYNYWCIEKGYAAYTGPYEDTPEWKRRAKGWISVMHLDAFAAMVVYTTVTAAFYLLGASILFRRGEIPQDTHLIATIANIYTQSLGNGVRIAYLVGAFFVLYSSVFATLAYWTRLFSDIFGEFGWMNFSKSHSRKRTVAILAWVFPFTWMCVYFFIELPLLMILSGGIVGSVLLLLVVYAAISFRYKSNFYQLKPLILYDIFLWLSVLSIFFIAVYGIIKLFYFI